MHLKCRLLVSDPLFEPSQFDILQEVIVDVLPTWVESMRLEVGEYHALPIHRGERWHESLMKLPATRRGLGSASLESNAGGVGLMTNQLFVGCACGATGLLAWRQSVRVLRCNVF